MRIFTTLIVAFLTVIVFVLAASYEISEIGPFSDYVSKSARFEPECEDARVRESLMESIGSSKSRLSISIIDQLLASRFNFDGGSNATEGHIHFALIRWQRREWISLFLPPRERVAAYCALGNAGGVNYNLVHVSRMVGINDLRKISSTELRALTDTYVNDLRVLITPQELRKRFLVRSSLDVRQKQ